MKRAGMNGTVSISGPGFERKGLPNVGAGISGALTAATRHREGTWYVRDGDVVKVWVIASNGVVDVVSKEGG